MSDVPDPAVNPATPWEFLPDDDQRIDPAVAPEEAAMHIEDPDGTAASIDEDPFVVVHYDSDEHPEVIDRSEPTSSDDGTPSVEELLVRQHYLPEEK